MKKGCEFLDLVAGDSCRLRGCQGFVLRGMVVDVLLGNGFGFQLEGLLFQLVDELLDFVGSEDVGVHVSVVVRVSA